MVVGGGLAVSTMSNLNPSEIELELWLGFDNKSQLTFKLLQIMTYKLLQIMVLLNNDPLNLKYLIFVWM